MPPLRDEALVLRRLDYSETSQVVVLFTRAHGKVRTLAKGIKRSTRARFATGIDLLELGSVVLNARTDRPEGLVPLTEWKQQTGFTELRTALPRLYAGQYAAEIAAQLTEDWDPHPELFAALVTTLGALCEADAVLGVVVAFQHELLQSIGSWPFWSACVLCGRATALTHFSSFEGGMVCKHCEPNQVEKRAVGASALAVLHGLPASATAPDAAEPALVGAFDALNYHLAHLMGKEPVLASKLVPAAQRRVVR